VTFESNDHVMRIIDRIVAPLGRRIDESSPYVDARLQDGSRVNAGFLPALSVIYIRTRFINTTSQRSHNTINNSHHMIITLKRHWNSM